MNPGLDPAIIDGIILAVGQDDDAGLDSTLRQMPEAHPVRRALELARDFPPESTSDELLELADQLAANQVDEAIIVLVLAWGSRQLFLAVGAEPAQEPAWLVRLRALCARSRHPAVRAQVHLAIAVAGRTQGVERVVRAGLLAAMAELPHGLPLRSNLFVHLANFCARSGLGRDLGADAPAFRPSDWPPEALLADAVETGRAGSAASRELAARALAANAGGASEFAFYVAAAALMEGVEHGGRIVDPPAGLAGWARDDLAACADLLRGDRTAIARHPRRPARSGSSLCAYTPIRAALVLGDWRLAEAAMQERRRLGCEHWLDHFFWSRIHHARGDGPAATAAFATAWRAAEHYEAMGRLRFELRMASDLDPLALVRYGGEVAAARPSAPQAHLSARSIGSSPGLVGDSPATRQLRERIPRLAAADQPVLIIGETGVGKDVVARALHAAGPHASEPFIAVNCAAIADGLLESELFGHVRGAFTGASGERIGLLAEAGAGTVLLDEIGDASPRFQAALLRLVESGEYRPVGASRDRRIACRLLAATHVDLAVAVEEGRFRADLFYRLQRLEVRIPPLRERPEDIVPLAQRFLSAGDSSPVIAAGLAARLSAMPWPGNVRELRNLVERMLINHPGRRVFDEAELPAARSPRTTIGSARRVEPGERDDAPDRRSRMIELFRQHGRLNRKQLVEQLGCAPSTATLDLRHLLQQGLIAVDAKDASPHNRGFRWLG